MAQLNDTQINGDLTVTGSINGSNTETALVWDTSTKVAEVGGFDIKVKLPNQPSNTAHAHSAGAGISLSGAGGVDGTTIINLKAPAAATASYDRPIILGGSQSSAMPMSGNLYYAAKSTSDSTPKVTVNPNSGKVTASSFNASSDARLKENFTEYTSEKSILDLPIYKFDFIDGAKDQIGCKAQDLQEICPEIVSEGSDGYLSIQESKIVYLLLEEVKKLKHDIQKLEETLNGNRIYTF